MRLLRSFMLDRNGATAVEYCLLAAMICVAAIGGFRAFSDQLEVTFATVEDGLTKE